MAAREPAGPQAELRPGEAELRPREAELRGVATRLFRERGFHGTSMQDLAEALGMNRGSLYHYIDSKDDLLWAIVVAALDRLRARVGPVLEAPGPGSLRLRLAIGEHLAFAAQHSDELSLVQIELRSLSPERRRALIGRRDAYEALWRGAIEDAVAEGTLRMADVRLAGIAILSACNWFTQWYRSDGPLTVDQIATAFADMYLCAPADRGFRNGPVAGDGHATADGRATTDSRVAADGRTPGTPA